MWVTENLDKGGCLLFALSVQSKNGNALTCCITFYKP